MENRVVFVDLPRTVPMPFEGKVMLTSPLEAKWVWEGVEKRLVIEEGFMSDGASIPKPFWLVVGTPFSPRFARGSMVHDKMCDLGWDVAEMSWLFHELLKLDNVGSKKACVMYKAVYAYKSFF